MCTTLALTSWCHKPNCARNCVHAHPSLQLQMFYCLLHEAYSITLMHDHYDLKSITAWYITLRMCHEKPAVYNPLEYLRYTRTRKRSQGLLFVTGLAL